MHKRKFTVFTQLHEENNADLIEYFDDRRKRQSKIVRKTFHLIKNADEFDKSSYNTHLQNEYGITKRTANLFIATIPLLTSSSTMLKISSLFG